MPTTPIAGITYPINSQEPDAPGQMAEIMNRIDSRLVSIFTDAPLRDSRIPVPEKGMICYLLDVRHYTIYRDGQWKKITIPTVRKVPPDSIATPLPKWINTTTRTVVPYLTTPVVAGKNYKVEGILFFVTPAVDYVDASVQVNTPGGMLAIHQKFLATGETQKGGIAFRRQAYADGGTFTCGIVDKTPVLMEGIYSCTTSGDLTISVAQGTLSAVELRMDAGSYLITKEF